MSSAVSDTQEHAYSTTSKSATGRVGDSGYKKLEKVIGIAFVS